MAQAGRGGEAAEDCDEDEEDEFWHSLAPRPGLQNSPSTRRPISARARARARDGQPFGRSRAATFLCGHVLFPRFDEAPSISIWFQLENVNGESATQI